MNRRKIRARFLDRRLSEGAIKVLLAANIDYPEVLLSMPEIAIENVPGLGQVRQAEVKAYVAGFKLKFGELRPPENSGKLLPLVAKTTSKAEVIQEVVNIPLERLDVSTLNKELVGCAWEGCAATFNGDLPPDWRWLLAWHEPSKAPLMSVAEVCLMPSSKRDAVLCPEHTAALEVALKARKLK